MRPISRMTCSLGMALAFTALARGADGPPPGVKELKDPKGLFTLQVPESWKTQPGGGDRLSAEAPDRSALLEVRSGAPAGASLEECAKALVKTAEETLRPWTESAREKVRLADLDALHIRGASKGVQDLATEHYLLLAKGGKVEIRLDFVCPADQAEKHKETFKAILASLRVRKGGSPGAQAQVKEEPATEPVEEPTDVPVTYKRIKDTGGWFSLAVPEDWKVEETAGSLVARPPGELGRVQVRRMPKEFGTLQKFVRDWLKAEKEAVVSWVKIGERPVEVAGRKAVQVRAEGEGPGEEGKPATFVADYIFFSGDRHHFLMTLACPKEKLPVRQPVFAQIMGSLQLTTPEAAPWIDPVRPAPADPEKGPDAKAPPQAPPTKTIEDPGGAFSFAVPADWRVQQKPGETAAADPNGRAVASVSAAPKEAQDLEQFTEAVRAKWQQTPGWTQLEWRIAQVANRPACHIRATATPAGQTTAVEHVLVLTETREIVLTLACPQADSEKLQAVFQQIIQSLRPR